MKKWLWFTLFTIGMMLLSAVIYHASGFTDLPKFGWRRSVEVNNGGTEPPCSLTAEETYARSLQLLSDGRQREAEDLIDSAAKRYRDDANITFAKAVLERSRWYIDTSHVWLSVVRRISRAEYLGRAVELALALDDHDDVDANMDALVRLSDEHPDDIYLLWLTAIQCRENEMGELGRERYELLFNKFQIGPVMAHQTYANILTEELEEYDVALPHRVKAVSMEPKSWSLQGLANTLTDMGDYEWANAVWAQMLRKDPNEIKYLIRYGFSLAEQCKFGDAASIYRKVVRERPTVGYYQYQLGICLDMLCQYEEAFKCFQKGVELGFEEPQRLASCYLFGKGIDQDVELGKQGFGFQDRGMQEFVEWNLGTAEKLLDWSQVSSNAVVTIHPVVEEYTFPIISTVVAACLANDRMDLAVAAQRQLLLKCEVESCDTRVIKAQRNRLAELAQQAENTVMATAVRDTNDMYHNGP